MRLVGQLCLLGGFVSTGYSALAAIVGWRCGHERLQKSGIAAAWLGLFALTAAIGVLLTALFTKDFRFAYVAQYSSQQLAPFYSLSSLWVGQAGSLLLWSWFCAVLSLVFYSGRFHDPGALRVPTLGVLMGFCFFLATVMVFAADPMARSLSPVRDGVGLSPVLQHPAMLIHPPIVFLGYAFWTVPFALVITALATGRVEEWVGAARPWAVLGWGILGSGILIGARWAYGELGWGGYWSWDPVENGSLAPWLIGTAAVHTLMAWRRCGMFKKSACALVVSAFGLCSFSTFLTRSGIFSSLHAFSQSPIGWLFLGMMIGVAILGIALIYLQRARLAPRRALRTVWCLEAMVAVSALALVALTAVICGGTLSTAISDVAFGRKITVGLAFYNNALIPTGLVVLFMTALAPLLRWGAAPTPPQVRATWAAFAFAVIVVIVAYAAGVRHPIELAVSGLAGLAAAALLGSLYLDLARSNRGLWRGLRGLLLGQRRQYAGFLIHVGLFCLAIGIAGSSLGSKRREAVMSVGDTVSWLGRQIRFARLQEREDPDKLVVEAQLDIVDQAGRRIALAPAQHYYYLQSEWTTEVAIGSTWSSDFYTILEGNEGDQRVRLTFVQTPLISLIWLGGCIMGVGTVVTIWPPRRTASTAQTKADAEQPKSARSGETFMRAASILLLACFVASQESTSDGPHTRCICDAENPANNIEGFPS
ncbi:MAG: cytochrome c biogenesis protein CcsA [Planctomycetales bacterium]|nr:cytochrome c biogenesis protein CcsA [Planctomycetales bacterium]